MGGCCSIGDSAEDSAYRLAGGKGRRQNNAEKRSLGGAPSQAAPADTPGGNGGAASTYGQRASFVYPKMPSLPKRTQIDSPSSASRKNTECSEAKIVALFEKYKEKAQPDLILMDGIVKFCNDLSVQPEDFQVLVIAWNFNAAQMGRFTRAEFLSGCKKVKCDSTKQILARLPELMRVLDNPLVFKDFYRWAYQFALDSEVGQRILSLDMAVQLWPLVFTNRPPPVMPAWTRFLKKSSGSVHSARGISRDTWNMFLHFVDTVGDKFELYSSEEAWPSLIDDFVEQETQGDQWRVTSAASSTARPGSSAPGVAPTMEVLEDVE